MSSMGGLEDDITEERIEQEVSSISLVSCFGLYVRANLIVQGERTLSTA
jgi:hypothetical protein